MKEEKIYLSIAGFIIQISFIKSEELTIFKDYYIVLLKKYYKNFLVINPSKKSDYLIEIVLKSTFQTMKQKEKEQVFVSFYEQITPRKIRTYYHVSGSLFQYIIRKVTHELLLKNNGFILHGSAVKINNNGVIFFGDSGAGKSTITQMLSSRFTIMGDDTVIVKKEEGKFYCYATSAIEKNSQIPKNSKRVILKQIYFLQKSSIHKISQMKNKDQIITLVSKQVYSETDILDKQFSKIAQFVNNFKYFSVLNFSLENKKYLSTLISSDIL